MAKTETSFCGRYERKKSGREVEYRAVEETEWDDEADYRVEAAFVITDGEEGVVRYVYDHITDMYPSFDCEAVFHLVEAAGLFDKMAEEGDDEDLPDVSMRLWEYLCEAVTLAIAERGK